MAACVVAGGIGADVRRGQRVCSQRRVVERTVVELDDSLGEHLVQIAESMGERHVPVRQTQLGWCQTADTVSCK